MYCILITLLLMMKINSINDEIRLHKYIMQYIWLLFILYLILLFNLKYNGFFNRLANIKYSDLKEFDTKNIFLKRSNFIPFKTISYYFYQFFNNYMATRFFIEKIAGNLIFLSPLGFFLPVFLKKLKKVSRFIIVYIGICVLSEILQILIGNGYMDIDDVILQFIGGVIVFVIFKLPPIQKLFMRLSIINQ